MGAGRGAYRILVGRLETTHLEDRGVDGMIILKCNFKKWDGSSAGLIRLRIGTGGGLLRNKKKVKVTL
jgi:hypothetical protein